MPHHTQVTIFAEISDGTTAYLFHEGAQIDEVIDSARALFGEGVIVNRQNKRVLKNNSGTVKGGYYKFNPSPPRKSTVPAVDELALILQIYMIPVYRALA